MLSQGSFVADYQIATIEIQRKFYKNAALILKQPSDLAVYVTFIKVEHFGKSLILASKTTLKCPDFTIFGQICEITKHV